MIRAYRLHAGPEGNSHAAPCTVNGGKIADAEPIHFKETAPCSTFAQCVIKLAGVLAFSTVDGETFTIRPEEVRAPEDHTGSGHKWRLANHEPWKRYSVRTGSKVKPVEF